MGKEFDELAKALASGVSRRSALKRFAAGTVGAAFASLFAGRSADAQSPPAICQQLCRQFVEPSSGRNFGQCVSTCSSCIDQGGTPVPVFLNGGQFVELVCVGLNSMNGG